MTKSRLFLKNSARAALNSFVIIILSTLFYGCSSNTKPTYLKDGVAQAVRDICLKEYKIEVQAKLFGKTLWIYLPLEDLLQKTDKPEKYTEAFTVDQNKAAFTNDVLSVDYLIKSVPEQEKTQEYKYDKAAIEKISNVWKTVRRVVFSMERSNGDEPEFYCLVTSDIKNGFETKEFFYYLDMIKVSYDFISWTEYQHRSVQETEASADIIADKEGKHLVYRDMTMQEFAAAQVEHRIKMKFGKPEVQKNADIDREVIKIIAYVAKIYDLKDLNGVVLYNGDTKNRVILNRPALMSKSAE